MGGGEIKQSNGRRLVWVEGRSLTEQRPDGRMSLGRMSLGRMSLGMICKFQAEGTASTWA